MQTDVTMVNRLLFFFNDTATTEIYTLSLHDALPIFPRPGSKRCSCRTCGRPARTASGRSEEHTSELQSREKLVCRLLLEKKKYTCQNIYHYYRNQRPANQKTKYIPK